jgi:hypothetical protein
MIAFARVAQHFTWLVLGLLRRPCTANDINLDLFAEESNLKKKRTCTENALQKVQSPTLGAPTLFSVAKGAADGAHGL